jgi:hypothetical protein
MKQDKLLSIVPHIVAPIIFIAISYAYFSPLLEGKQLAQHDIAMYKGSAKEIIDYKAATGEQTLWTNSMFSGMPAYLISVNYPGNLLPYINRIIQLVQRPASFIFSTMLGFYILLLVLGVNPWLSIVGAIAYGFSSYFFIIIGAGHNAKIHAISYVAPMIAGIILAFRQKYISGFVLFALFFGLNLYTGHPQITYYAAFVMIALVVAYYYDALRSVTYNYPSKVKRILATIATVALGAIYLRKPTPQLAGFAKAVRVLFLAAILAVGANFSRMWFTYDYGKFSIRGPSELTSETHNRTSGLDKDYATQWSYGTWETFNILIPNLTGGASAMDIGEDSHTYAFLKKNGVPTSQAKSIVSQIPTYWGDQPSTSGPVYVGAIVFFLFVFGLFVVKGAGKWALLIVTLLSIFLAMGHNFKPLTNLFLDFFPGYNKFRTVSMILYIAEFTMPFIGFLALKRLWDGAVSKDTFHKALKWSVGIVGGICLFFFLLGGSIFDFSALVDQQLQSSGWPAELLNALRDDRRAMLRTDAFRSLVFTLVTASALLAFYTRKLKPQYFVVALGLLVITDMWPVNKRYLKNDNFVSPRKVQEPFSPTAADMQILQDKSLSYRVFNMTVSPFNDASTSYFHKSIGGYHGAKLRRYQEVIDQHLSRGNMAVFNMLNTKYFIQQGQKGPVAQLNQEALGNCWFVDSVRFVGNADEELDALTGFDPRRVAIVDERFRPLLATFTPATDTSDRIVLEEYYPNRLVYKSTSHTNRLAVFSEIYYPKGWTVSIDGQPAEHFRANYILRAMTIPAGEHRVEFRFEPAMFRVGKNIDFACSLIIILSFAGWVFVELKKWIKE